LQPPVAPAVPPLTAAGEAALAAARDLAKNAAATLRTYKIRQRLSWLRVHWGVTDRLRQVVEREKATTGRRLPKSHAVLGYGYFTPGETPDTAITRIATRWPNLRFVLQLRPAD
jgi:hypothetical protein